MNKGRQLYTILAFTLTLLAPAAGRAQSLPSGWSLGNVGSPALAGRGSYASKTFTLEGAGADIWGTSDQFVFAHRRVSGDARIVARVASLENTDHWAKAGVMIRESLAGNSKYAFALVSPGKGLAFQRRSGTGSSATNTAGGTGTAPVWLMIERRGTTLTASRSPDGVTWTSIGSATISMASSVYVGLAVTSHVASTRATATFTGVGVGHPLPSGWSSGDIGSPAIRGFADYSASVFTIDGAGADIWDTSDQFTFAYRRVSGDVDVVARVRSIEAVDNWTKAGVMVRASLRRDAAHASLFASVSKGIAFQRRAATAHQSLHTSGGSGTAPVWLKLERRGSAVTAFRSSNGSSWTMIDSQTLTLPSTFYVGLAVTSHDAAAAATASFGNVSITSASPGNSPPSVSLSAPAAGATFSAGASIAISANASDSDGSIARVEFYRGSTLIGSDSSSPYGVTWTNAAAGSYSLTAVAIDNDGASTRSSARSITVAGSGGGGGQTPPTTAIFTPSSDHDSSRVTSYRLEIFTAGANPSSANPIAVRNLGKPSVSNGECRANIAPTIDGLPSGSYFATVVAVGPGGTSARATSAVFRR